MKKYKGIRRRKWGKWVSEIRIPGTQERLWLGSYSSPEAAAVAHDVAYYCLRRPATMEQLNFPGSPIITNQILRHDMSPGSIQKAASDAAMAVDAQYICNNFTNTTHHNNHIIGSSGSSSRRGVGDDDTGLEHHYNRTRYNWDWEEDPQDCSAMGMGGPCIWPGQSATHQQEAEAEAEAGLSVSIEDYL